MICMVYTVIYLSNVCTVFPGDRHHSIQAHQYKVVLVAVAADAVVGLQVTRSVLEILAIECLQNLLIKSNAQEASVWGGGAQ